MTVSEFDDKIKQWAKNITSLAKAKLSATNGTGELQQNLHNYVDPIKNKTGRRIAFKFPRHGVFRHYGAGRGYIIVNGQPVRGHRVLSLREIAAGLTNSEAQDMAARGYTNRAIRSAKKAYQSNKRIAREPLDWLDGYIGANTGPLADISAQFYGDASVEQVLKQIDKTKIVKL